jgi:hypothetical protein
MLRRTYTIILAVTLLCTTFSFSQTYQGPAAGSVDSGAVVSTNSFSDFPIPGDTDPIIRGEMNFEGSLEPLLIESDGREIFPNTYTEDLYIGDNPLGIGDNAMLLQKYKVTLDNNVIPPDPTIAVGPNHVMVLTNNGVGIRIYDKQGTLLKSINSNSFWSGVWFRQDGDPQILYDHFSGRWFMLFMQYDDIALTAGNLIAYSDDDDPLGTWYTYRLDTKLHGTTTSNTWGDYPQIGFDEQAIYIMTRCFTFAAQPQQQYTKIRILSKTELYSSNAGPLTYKDIWNIYDSSLPVNQQYPDIIHPSFQYSAAGEHYFLYAYRGGGNFYSFYKLSNPLTAPVLTRVNINVPFFGTTPDARQLGGGTVVGDTIAANGSHIKTAPIFRDGFLYAVHSMRNSVYPSFASIKYVKIDVGTNTVVESAELGANGYFYIYPALAVDKNGNVGITCSRSALTEYIGSYFTTRRASDPAGLGNSQVLQPGLGKYVLTFGGSRNRWGDYLGVFLDPADEYSFWMLSQYASGTNAYACVVGQVRLEPFSGIYVFPETQNYDFGSTEIGNVSDTIDALIANYGTDDLIISSIPLSVGDYSLVSNHTFPITLQTFDTLVVKFVFNPTSIGDQNVDYQIVNNSTSFTGLNFTGIGYEMQPATDQKLYAVSGTQNSGQTLSINKSTGVGINIGSSNYTDLIGLAIHPETKIIYSIRSSAIGSTLLRLNSSAGDAYPLYSYPLTGLFSIAFDSSGTLYGVLTTGQVYTLNLENGSYTLVTTIPCQRISVRFHPQTNELWGTVKNFLGNPKDQLVKIDLSTGDTTRFGRTGYNVNTLDLAFDEANQLYGIKGSGTLVSDLFRISQTTGSATMIGSVGLKDLTGLSYSGGVTDVEDEDINIPSTYFLEQNYPNPFNPSTQIKFSLPISSNVKITIYNLLGEVVRELVNTDMNSGIHTVQWNSDDVSGKKVSSGIYFYELNANGVNGNKFNQVRKMILLK